MDPNEIQTTISINTITSYLVTLYAVVPSIIITMMYSFLSDTEEEVSCLWPKIVKYKEKKPNAASSAVFIYRFIIISSKMFHLSMAYYLIMLLTSLFSKCMGWQLASVTNAFLVASIFCSGYSIAYLKWDAYKAFKGVFDENSHKRTVIKDSHKKYLWILLIVIEYAFFPLALALYMKLRNRSEEALHLFWITLTMVHLSFWWLSLPFLYKPLTRLSYIRRELGKLPDQPPDK